MQQHKIYSLYKFNYRLFNYVIYVTFDNYAQHIY